LRSRERGMGIHHEGSEARRLGRRLSESSLRGARRLDSDNGVGGRKRRALAPPTVDAREWGVAPGPPGRSVNERDCPFPWAGLFVNLLHISSVPPCLCGESSGPEESGRRDGDSPRRLGGSEVGRRLSESRLRGARRLDSDNGVGGVRGGLWHLQPSTREIGALLRDLQIEV